MVSEGNQIKFWWKICAINWAQYSYKQRLSSKGYLKKIELLSHTGYVKALAVDVSIFVWRGLIIHKHKSVLT